MEKEQSNEIISRIQDAKKSIEALSKEATSFSKTKAELNESAASFNELLDSLNDVLDTTEEIRKEVSSVATNKTLKSLEENSAKFQEIAKVFVTEHTEKTDAMIKAIQESNDNTIKKMKKTSIITASILGGIAVVSSIVALIISLL
jgi:ABC-type transporter Mla subunit MlaD